jgi:adenylate cyclase
MSEEQAKRKLAAILSADAKDYSRLMEDDEEATVQTITAYRELMVRQIQNQNGRVVDAKGDNLLAEFGSVVDAVRCAVGIQKELGRRNEELSDHRKMQFRIGVNLGDVIEEDETIYGDGVNIAARLEALAEGGGICISGTAFDHIRKRLSVGYEYLGEQAVKNIENPVRVYRVLMEPEAVGKVIGEERPKRLRLAAIAVALILVVGGLAIWNFYFRPPPIEPASVERMAFPLPDKPSIAVLPFVNMGGDPEQEYFCDGITDQIITSLSIIPRLFIVARNSTFAYKGKAVKVQKVAEELGVRYVLEGSVQRSEERIRILVQLIDATTGHHLWSERYDRELKDLFALQDEIALKIMTALQVKLTEGEYARVLARGTSNLQAMESFWRAEELFFRFSKEDNAGARRWVEKAIDLDSNFAGAWALNGYTHMTDVVFGFSKSPVQSTKQAEECAQKAIALDVSNAKAYGLLGRLRGNQRKFDEAIEYGEKSVALNPNDPHMLVAFAVTMHFYGRFEESIALIKKAMRLSPYYPAVYLQNLAQSYVLTERYEEAIATSKLLLDRSRKGEFNLLFPHLLLAEAYVGLGQEEEARAHAEEVLKINPNFSLKKFPLLYVYRDPIHSERRITALSKAGLPEKPPLPLPDKPSIAVLPFASVSGDAEQEYLSDGITDSIITALSKIPDMFVIARNSVFTYKGKPVKIQRVSKDLGVRYVLEGSLQKTGDRVRITAQLIDAFDGHHLWSEKYDRDMKDFFAVQDEITKKILTTLQLELTIGGTALASSRGTNNLEAYLGFLKGLKYFWHGNKDDNAMAKQIFEEVIETDPNYPAAYSLLAATHLLDVFYGASKSPPKSIERVVELSQKALSLDDCQDTAYRLMSMVYMFKRQYDKANAEAERAVACAPNSSLAYTTLGTVRYEMGRYEESIPIIKKATRLNPYPPHYVFENLGKSHLNLYLATHI